ncbi:MAG: hypothetical protein NVSMB27_26930 [Ktedonobacteraceae bacterium]
MTIDNSNDTAGSSAEVHPPINYTEKVMIEAKACHLEFLRRKVENPSLLVFNESNTTTLFPSVDSEKEKSSSPR